MSSFLNSVSPTSPLHLHLPIATLLLLFFTSRLHTKNTEQINKPRNSPLTPLFLSPSGDMNTLILGLSKYLVYTYTRSMTYIVADLFLCLFSFQDRGLDEEMK